MSNVYIGVDPGYTGAICIWERIEGDDFITVVDMPIHRPHTQKRIDREAVVALLLPAIQGRKVAAAVEKVGVRGDKLNADGTKRSEGPVGMLNFGQGQGEVLGIITALLAVSASAGVVMEPPPSVWKMRAGLIKVSEKETCKRAAAICPNVEFFGPKGGALHGRAEALFIAKDLRDMVEGW